MMDGDHAATRRTVDEGDGVRFEGRFLGAKKNGLGTLYFADGSTLKGKFVDDALQGQGVYTNPDGSRVEGTYADGELNGIAREYAPDGSLTAEYRFVDGQRVGQTTVFFADGGKLIGEIDPETGAIAGSARYVYPNGGELVGQWSRDGRMDTARFRRTPDASPERPVYKYDESTADRISSSPLLPDPYEHALVYVKRSQLPNAGEGLFARVAIKARTVVSFYNGVRLTHDEVDARDWALNNNTIALDDDVVIDVPAPFDSTSHYCASLGHKANHRFGDNNAVYDVYDHPRFGLIKSVRTIRDVVPDEEITVVYGYEDCIDRSAPDGFEAPSWYREQLASVQPPAQTQRSKRQRR